MPLLNQNFKHLDIETENPIQEFENKEDFINYLNLEPEKSDVKFCRRELEINMV
jgi:hypothetical protein